MKKKDIKQCNQEAGEMAQQLRALAALLAVLSFNSQQPYGGSQPSVIGYDVLFWHAGIYVEYS